MKYEKVDSLLQVNEFELIQNRYIRPFTTSRHVQGIDSCRHCKMASMVGGHLLSTPLTSFHVIRL